MRRPPRFDADAAARSPTIKVGLRIISVDYEEPIVLDDRRRDAAGDYDARPATGFPQRATRGVEHLPVKRAPECETRSVAPGEQRVPHGSRPRRRGSCAGSGPAPAVNARRQAGRRRRSGPAPRSPTPPSGRPDRWTGWSSTPGMPPASRDRRAGRRRCARSPPKSAAAARDARCRRLPGTTRGRLRPGRSSRPGRSRRKLPPLPDRRGAPARRSSLRRATRSGTGSDGRPRPRRRARRRRRCRDGQRRPRDRPRDRLRRRSRAHVAVRSRSRPPGCACRRSAAGLRLQPDDVHSTVRPDRKLRAVDRSHSGYREIAAVDSLRHRPAGNARSVRCVEQVATVGSVRDVDEVHRALGVDDGPRHPAALGDPERCDRRA